MQTSWQKLVDIVEDFANQHPQIKRFKSDFVEQFSNFANEGEEFAVMYLVTPSGGIGESVDTYVAEVFVLDQIMEGRENLTGIVSDSHLILTDLFKFVRDSYELEIDITGDGTRESVNNSLMDGLAGAKAFLTFEVDSIGSCLIPSDEKLQ